MRNYLERVRRRANRLLGNGPIILMYHHIGSPTIDPWKLAVSAFHFQQHVEVLSQHRRVMSLAEMARRHEAGQLPPDAAAITFDDGYASNLHLAKPALERRGAPATVFVTSGFLGGNSEPWWDELAALLLGPTQLPETIRLNLGTAPHEWRAREWSHRRRRVVHDEIHRILVRVPWEHQCTAIRVLRDQMGDPKQPVAARRIVSPQELIDLADGDLIEIGAHTVTHPSLPLLDAAAQYGEIQGSKAALEARLLGPVRSLAYPYGDHNAKTVTAAMAAGISCACTTAQGFVHPRDSLLRLPRFVVNDWDGEEFAKRFVRPISRSR